MTNEMCLQMHKLISHLPVYSWETMDEIPFLNGIYFVFEKGETYHGLDRIVRVGINKEPDRLKKRLKNHFSSKSHGSSIFIKNIGRAYLNQADDDYLKIWNMKKPGTLQDLQKQNYYQEKASQYLKNNMTFTVIHIEDAAIRKRLEGAVISTLCYTDDFFPSKNWLGRFSPEEKIRNSGMWVAQGLNSEILTESEMTTLVKLAKSTMRLPS